MSKEKQRSTVSGTFIERLRTEVLEHYSDERFGVSELVELYGLSRSQLHRKLKAATGQSISQFIREIRLDEALKLLQQEDLTASEVSYKVGFNSPTYFNTCFNEYFGYPPGEVKHQMALGILGRSAEMVSAKTPKKNRSVKFWLIGITLVASGFFLFKYWQQGDHNGVTKDVVKPKTIAVLPFKNWSGNPDLEYVSDGMTDAVITRLSRISDIDKVVPFSTVISYKNSDKVTSEIAKELNVAYILEGNFKLSGDQVMSNLNLIEVASNEYIWSLEYTGKWKADEIFEMQAAVAENVAGNMKASVSSKEKAEINRSLTQNVEAYRYLLEGDAQYYKLNPQGLENAIQLYMESIKLDSTFVDAYIGLGRTHMLCGLVWGVKPQQEAFSKAKPALLKAQRLDQRKNGLNEELISSLLATASFYFELDISIAESYFMDKLSSAVKPRYRDFYFDYTRKTGRFDKTMEILQREMEQYPSVSDAYWQKGLIHIMRGEKNEALNLLETYDLYYEDNFFYLQETSKWYYYMGEVEKSKVNLDKLLKKFNTRPPIINWSIAVHAQLSADQTTIVSALAELRKQYESRSSGSPAWFIAMYYCHTKEYDKAFEWLNRSYQNKEVELTWFMEEPLLKPLKTDPRYVKIYNKLGFDVVAPLEPVIP